MMTGVTTSGCKLLSVAWKGKAGAWDVFPAAEKGRVTEAGASRPNSELARNLFHDRRRLDSKESLSPGARTEE